MAKNRGIFLFSIKGCFINISVLKPNLSFSISALEQDDLKFLASGLFSMISLANGCSNDMAQKVAPKIVSGLVVNTFNELLEQVSKFSNVLN